MAARGGAGEHQVREIHASHKQDQSNDCGENVERAIELRVQAASDSFRGRRNVKTHGKKGLAPQTGSLRGGRGEKYVRPEGLELGASLFDSDAVLQAGNGIEPEDRAACHIEAAGRNERYGRKRNGKFRRLPGREAGEPFAGGAHERERMAFDTGLLTLDVARD